VRISTLSPVFQAPLKSVVVSIVIERMVR